MGLRFYVVKRSKLACSNYFNLFINQCLEGWFLGKPVESCDSACSRKGLICTESEFLLHMNEVDSNEKVMDLINKLGEKTNATSCNRKNLGENRAVPLFNDVRCIYTTTGDRFRCTNRPGPPAELKQRICYCHQSTGIDQ